MDAKKLGAALVRARGVSTSLDTAADQLNNSLRGLEQAIRGLELRVTESIVIETDFEDFGDTPTSRVSLCWMKLDGTWSLAIEISQRHHEETIHVTAASLYYRKLAAQKVHELVEAIATSIEKQVKELEEARKKIDAVTNIVLGEDW